MADRAWAPSHADPVPPRLYPPCEGRVPRSPPHYLRSLPESGPGLASPGPPPSSLGPGRAAHTPPPPTRPTSASAHLARLVELLLQPRHRHAAFHCRACRPDPANRRDRASDRFPGATNPQRASAGPFGTASAALKPAPPALAPPQTLQSPRGQDITWQPHTSGAGPPSAHARSGPRLRTRAPCRWGVHAHPSC